MLPKQNPCRMNGDEAPYAVTGYEPNMDGGGVLFWAYSLEEAGNAADAFRNEGYKQVKVYREGPRRQEMTDQIIWGLVMGDDL
jgi:hypothetical protein